MLRIGSRRPDVKGRKGTARTADTHAADGAEGKGREQQSLTAVTVRKIRQPTDSALRRRYGANQFQAPPSAGFFFGRTKHETDAETEIQTAARAAKGHRQEARTQGQEGEVNAKQAFGWKVGDTAAYTYRSAKHPKGKVTAVHPGTTRKTATVTIEPAPAYRFGEGKITRHLDKIRRAKLTPSDRLSVKKKGK